MDSPESYNPKIFNLQLLVQRLESELMLYRNGTTSAQIYEVLQEKEAECNELKAVIIDLTTNGNDTNEKLRRLAKTSSELLTKCQSLEAERNQLQEDNNELKDALAAQGNLIDEAGALKKNAVSIVESLENDLNMRDDSICKLQARCASLVTEKNEKNKLLAKEKAEKTTIIAELKGEIDRGIRYNDELKSRLSAEYDVTTALKAQLIESRAESKEAVSRLESATSQIESLDKEINKLMNDKSIRQKMQSDKDVIIAQLEAKIREKRVNEEKMRIEIADQRQQLEQARQQAAHANPIPKDGKGRAPLADASNVNVGKENGRAAR